jgi:hypothetical protein
MKNAIAILALAAALFGGSVEWASASHGPSERNWCSIDMGNDSTAC